MAEKVDGRLCDYGSSMDESGDESKSGGVLESANGKTETPKDSFSHESDDHKSVKEDTSRVVSKTPRQYRKASRSSSREGSSLKRSKHGNSRRHRSRSKSCSRSHRSHRHRRDCRHRRRRHRSRDESSHRRRPKRRSSSSVSRSSTSRSRSRDRRSSRCERDRDGALSRKIVGSRGELARARESVKPVDPIAARLEAANKASAIMASAFKPGKSNPQDALARFQETQMAQVRAKAEAAAAAANLPSYYNPLSVNAAKMAEQQQKRKLLWSKKSDSSKDPKEDAKSNLWKTTSLVAGKGDSVAAAKFCKLMGIHDVGELNVEKPGASTSKAREQADLFRKLEQEYEQSRTLTHTQRGVGLGYSSAMTDFNAYSAMRQAGANNDPARLNDE